MNTAMRAKLRVSSVQELFSRDEGDSEKFGEQLYFHAVARNDAYPEDGSDENNTYAQFSPTANFFLDCRNPNLWGKFKVGEEYYVDFIPAGK